MDTKLIVKLLIGLIMGAILALPLTPVFCLLRKMFYVPFIQKKVVNEAIEMGHVVTATLERASDSMEERGKISAASGKRVGLYRYEYEGKQYRRRLMSYDLQDEILLYFQKNPARAAPADRVGFIENNWFQCYLITAVILMALGAILGVCV